MQTRRTLVNVGRGIVILLACGIGWYLAAQVRSMRPGFHLWPLLAQLAFTFLPAVSLGLLSAVGLEWRTKSLIIGCVVAVAVSSSEVWAAAEEYAFVRQHQGNASGPTPRLFFSESWFAYDPATGTLSGSD
jgi:Na+/proline symporter